MQLKSDRKLLMAHETEADVSFRNLMLLRSALANPEGNAAGSISDPNIKELFFGWSDTERVELKSYLDNGSLGPAFNQVFLADAFEPSQVRANDILDPYFGKLKDDRLFQIKDMMIRKGPCLDRDSDIVGSK